VLGTSKPEAARMAAVRYTFVVAGAASLLLAVFSLFLPHTPPKPAAKGGESLAWLEAIKLLRYPFLLVLFIVTFFDAGVHQCYFLWTDTFLRSVGIPGNWVMPVMSIGQVAEILTMAILGVVLKRFGWKTTMIVGVLGHTLRFGVFALAPEPALAVLVNVVHGICYAFYFATVYIFVDEFFPKDARSSAQGLFNFLILGAGPFVGNFVWPAIGESLIRPVPHVQQSEASATIESSLRSVILEGKAAPDAKVTVVFKNADPSKDNEKSRITEHVVANDKGEWKLGQQYIGGLNADRVQIATEGGQIEKVLRYEYREIFLYPAGTALAAALLLLFFFHPPKKREAAAPDAIQAL
jgi:hypothetical protein